MSKTDGGVDGQQATASAGGGPEALLSERLRNIVAGLPEERNEVRGQLASLADAVEAGGPAAGDWASLDLTSYFDLDALARWTAPRLGAMWLRLERLRNVSIFLPIVVTWLGISSAVSAYQADIYAHPEDSKVPFLLLWQQGFGGRLDFPNLGTMAFVDALIVLGIIGLTLLLDSTSAARVNSANELVARRSDIRQALVDAGRLLAQYRVEGPEPWLAELMTASRELLQEMRAERDRVRDLTHANTAQAQHLATAGGHLEASSAQLSSLTVDLQSFTKSMDRSSRSLFAKAEAAAAKQIEAATRLRDTNAAVADVLNRQEAESKQRQAALESVTHYQRQIGDIARDLDGVVKSMDRAMKDLHAAVEVAARLIEQVEGVELVVDAGPEPPRPSPSAWYGPTRTTPSSSYPPPPPMASMTPTPADAGPGAAVIAPAPPAGPAQTMLDALRRWLRFGG